MNVLKSLWAAVESHPVYMQKIHGWLTIVWFIASFPIMVYWSENIKFLVFISVYAVVTGHWSSWQASRVEVKQEADSTKREENPCECQRNKEQENGVEVRDSTAG